ncbi:MAG: hypothetical protein ABSE51_05800 [Terracidiphilus sp.]|jgi:hypothetical protein
MQARGYAELTTTELPDELRFTVVRQVTARRWFYRAAKLALTYTGVALFLIALCWVCGWKKEYSSALYISTGMFIANFFELAFHCNVSELRVTDGELVAAINPGKRFFSREDTVAVYRVSSIGWRGGGLLLVIDSFWKRAFRILPGLNKDQGKAVLDTIRNRFPDIWEEHYGTGWVGIRPSSFPVADDEGLNAKL